jgi:prepilin-type processing-associated H-X9-DG protein
VTSANFDAACSGTSDRRGFARSGVLYVDSSVRLADILDGTSNTLAVGERHEGETSWLAGISNALTWPCDSAGFKNVEFSVNFCGPRQSCSGYGNSRPFSSHHPGGAQFVLCDGSVRFVTDSCDLRVLQAAASRSGGETDSLP